MSASETKERPKTASPVPKLRTISIDEAPSPTSSSPILGRPGSPVYELKFKGKKVFQKTKDPRFDDKMLSYEVAFSLLYQVLINDTIIPTCTAVMDKNSTITHFLVDGLDEFQDFVDYDGNITDIKKFFTRDFADILSVSYFLEESDLNLGNLAHFMASKQDGSNNKEPRTGRIDFGYTLSVFTSLNNLIIDKDYLSKAGDFPLSEEVLKDFPYLPYEILPVNAWPLRIKYNRNGEKTTYPNPKNAAEKIILAAFKSRIKSNFLKLSTLKKEELTDIFEQVLSKKDAVDIASHIDTFRTQPLRKTLASMDKTKQLSRNKHTLMPHAGRTNSEATPNTKRDLMPAPDLK